MKLNAKRALIAPLLFSLSAAGLCAAPAQAADLDLESSVETQTTTTGVEPNKEVLALSRAFRTVAENLENSVVRVVSTDEDFRATGSGFVIRPDGYLLTNNHVVARGSVVIEFANGERYPASIVGADELTDLAVVQIPASNLTAAPFSSADLSVGDWVVAMGCPLGLEQSVTAGIVSATNRRLGIIRQRLGRRGGRLGYEDFIQTDAAINKGNSGGPLLNLRGEVVGVNTAILTETGGSDGLGFAIPTSLASAISQELITHGRVRRGFLGINIQNIDSNLARSYNLPADQHGVLVTSVSPGSAAARAGLEVEDLITEIDGVAVFTADELRNRIAMTAPGSRVPLTLIRDGRRRVERVELDELPGGRSMSRGPEFDPELDGRLGMTYRMDDRGRLRVTSVARGGPADLAGIEANDWIQEVNGEAVASLTTASERRDPDAAWLTELIDDARQGAVIRFRVGGSGSPTFYAVEVQ